MTVKQAKIEALAKEKEDRELARRVIKYPIEDLDLDPMSIFDGRVLRRINVDLPPLPSKGTWQKDLPLQGEAFETLLMVWNFLNVFGYALAPFAGAAWQLTLTNLSNALSLSNFTLDDFELALTHSTLEPRCSLLAEMHAVLLNTIVAENFRIQGCFPLTFTGPLPEFEEFDEPLVMKRLVMRGLRHCMRWDRLTKLKAVDGRAGWERHLVGAILQRGGLEVLPTLPRILRHFFVHESTLPTSPIMDDVDVADDDGDVVAQQYLSLEVSDKLAILRFLCDLVTGSKSIRGYLDECETVLTELRKERAELNKDRKTL